MSRTLDRWYSRHLGTHEQAMVSNLIGKANEARERTGWQRPHALPFLKVYAHRARAALRRASR